MAFFLFKNSEEIEKKLKSYLHHREYELNMKAIGAEKIKNLMEQRKTVYNLKQDQRLNKFNSENKLKKIDINPFAKIYI